MCTHSILLQSKLLQRKPLHRDIVYTERLLHREAFTQHFFAEKLLHRGNICMILINILKLLHWQRNSNVHNGSRNCSSKTRYRHESEQKTIMKHFKMLFPTATSVAQGFLAQITFPAIRCSFKARFGGRFRYRG